MTEADLTEYFSKFGSIEEIKIINNQKSKRLKGFAMISFENSVPRDILNTVHKIQDKELEVREYLSEEESNTKLELEKDRKIFVGGLPLSIDSKTLKQFFQQFGPVVDANVVYQYETMKSRGFAFVVFEKKKTLEEVLSRHDDHYIYGKWVN